MDLFDKLIFGIPHAKNARNAKFFFENFRGLVSLGKYFQWQYYNDRRHDSGNKAASTNLYFDSHSFFREIRAVRGIKNQTWYISIVKELTKIK